MFPFLTLLFDLLIDLPKQGYRAVNAVMSGDCVVDGVRLPPRKIFGNWQYIKLLLTLSKGMISTRQLLSYFAFVTPRIMFLHRSKKTQENLKGVHDFFVRTVVKHTEYLPKGYQHFAGNLSAKRLVIAFVRANPFFAAALQAVVLDNGNVEYHIKGHDASGKNDNRNWFTRFAQTYNLDFPRVNAVFDANFNLKSFDVYQLSLRDDNVVATQVVGLSENVAMERLLFMLGYHFECVHALIHIFQTLLVSGLVNSARNTTTLAAFAGRYDENMYAKYMEVKLLLLAPDAGLTGKSHKGVRAKLLPELAALLKLWGSCRTSQEFVEKFILRDVLSTVDRKTLEKSDILTEFLKHVNLTGPFAKDLDDVFRLDADEYEVAMGELKIFFENTGVNGPRVDNLKTWIELMSITGIIHGATLSGTRLLASIQVLKQFFNYFEDRFDSIGFRQIRGDDLDTLRTLLGTVTGIQEEKDVFGNDLRFNQGPLVRAVEARYGGISAGYKLDYFNQIKKHSGFKEFGWIWTDYCPDMIDSKQFTIDTYV